MTDELKLYLMCFIRNVITLICFTILAIVFHKWWIIFFSLIFWISVEDKEENK